MNELIELRMRAGESSTLDHDEQAGNGLIELGHVVSETKAHNHGSNLEPSNIFTTAF